MFAKLNNHSPWRELHHVNQQKTDYKSVKGLLMMILVIETSSSQFPRDHRCLLIEDEDKFHMLIQCCLNSHAFQTFQIHTATIKLKLAALRTLLDMFESHRHMKYMLNIWNPICENCNQNSVVFSCFSDFRMFSIEIAFVKSLVLFWKSPRPIHHNCWKCTCFSQFLL